MIKYFEQYIPQWLIPEIETVAASIGSYFPADYAAEMTAIAPVLGLKLGGLKDAHRMHTTPPGLMTQGER